MKKIDDVPSRESVNNLLGIIRPGSRLISILPVDGGYSNFTHLIDAVDPDGRPFKIVIRRYAVFGSYERGQKARREFMALKFAHENGIPTPEPLYLDETGEVLGIPGIVTSFVDGKIDLTPPNPEYRAKRIAEVLVKIHSLPCAIPDGSYILDANAEASWFLRDDKAPDYMKSHPLGFDVVKAARELFPSVKSVKPSLVHIDIWPGNILWKDDKISAMVDWEEAAYGDPAIDVGYCRMELSVAGYFSAADTLLETYESLIGKSLDNLLFWELAAIARPIFSPEIWDVVDNQRSVRFTSYIEGVLRKCKLR